MARAYKNGRGRLTHRSSNGRFRKSTLKDVGIYDGNEKCDLYRCNICGDEFIPLVLSAVCCGQNNISKVEPVYNEKQLEILKEKNAIINKPFINRLDLEKINQLERDFQDARTKT